MVSKAVAFLVSLILVAGIVIGVLAVANRNASSNDFASTKHINTICSPTDFKETCMNSLSHVATNESATPKDYILAAIHATIEESMKSLKVVESIKVDPAKHQQQTMAVQDCKELLRFSINELEAALWMVAHSDLYTIHERVFEILNWFTAVVSYQQTCLDQLHMPQYRIPIKNGLLNTTQLTSNAVNIVAHIADTFHAFNIEMDDLIKANSSSSSNSNSNSRRLLEVIDVGHDGYPSWFSTADRKLLDLHNLGKRRVTPNAVVAKDGSGQYKTISAALVSIPEKRKGRWTIYVKAGVYNEAVTITEKQSDVFMYGDGPTKTIVTGSGNCAIDKLSLMRTATVTAIGNRFMVEGMGFHNTAGPKGHQAIAFLTHSDMSTHFNCRFEGYQDTLYYIGHRQFYRDCVISGTIDFIFGGGTALIQNSDIVLRMPEPYQQNVITADGNNERNTIGGLVLQNCRIVPEPRLLPNRLKIRSFLGRPWKQCSTTAIIESHIGDLIQPEGWMVWNGKNNHKTAIVAEYGNRGPGANTTRRVKWNYFRAITNRNEALRFTVPVHLEGGKNPLKWVLSTGVPVDMGLTRFKKP